MSIVAWTVKLLNSALAVYPGFKVHQRDVSLSRVGDCVPLIGGRT